MPLTSYEIYNCTTKQTTNAYCLILFKLHFQWWMTLAVDTHVYTQWNISLSCSESACLLEKPLSYAAILFIVLPYKKWGRAVAWLVEATSRKVAVSIPYAVFGFFNWPKLSNRTMTLGSTQPLTEMSTRNVSGGKERPAGRRVRLTNSPPPLSPFLKNVAASTSHYAMDLHALLQGQRFSFTLQEIFLITTVNSKSDSAFPT
jgi:hypothetical protein